MSKPLPLFAFCLILLACADTDPDEAYFKGAAAANAGNFAEARRIWEPLARKGSAKAQVGMGAIYTRGLGVEKDPDAARAWYLKAAEQGDPIAQYNLGSIHEFGNGVAVDDTEAVRWYRLAAEQGNVDGELRLGEHYLLGQGVEKDLAEAYLWLGRAADQNDGEARRWIDKIAADAGILVKKHDAETMLEVANLARMRFDENTSQVIYHELAQRGNADAQNEIGFGLLKSGLATNHREALEWFQKAAANDHAPAQNNLGMMYKDGMSVEQDYQSAMQWFRKSAQQNYPRALVNIAFLYVNGLGVEQDVAMAQQWNLKAAELGSPEGQANIGRAYYTGRGVEKDLDLAFDWLTKSAQQNHSSGQLGLAVMYFVGDGIAKNEAQAYRWGVMALASAMGPDDLSDARDYLAGLLDLLPPAAIEQGSHLAREAIGHSAAAEAGDPKAQVDMGYLYGARSGSADDRLMAKMWFRRSAMQGLMEGQRALGGWYMLQDTREDRIQALKWMLLASAQGDERAKETAVTLVTVIPESDFEEAQRLVKEHLSLSTN
jgi:TPR repeat protein